MTGVQTCALPISPNRCSSDQRRPRCSRGYRRREKLIPTLKRLNLTPCFPDHRRYRHRLHPLPLVRGDQEGRRASQLGRRGPASLCVSPTDSNLSTPHSSAAFPQSLSDCLERRPRAEIWNNTLHGHSSAQTRSLFRHLFLICGSEVIFSSQPGVDCRLDPLLRPAVLDHGRSVGKNVGSKDHLKAQHFSKVILKIRR